MLQRPVAWAPDDLPLGGHPTGHPQPCVTLDHLLDLDFENLLPGHGKAILGDAKANVRSMIDRRVSTTTAPPRVTYFPNIPLDKNPYSGARRIRAHSRSRPSSICS